MQILNGGKLAISLSLFTLTVCLIILIDGGFTEEALVSLLRVSAKFSLSLFMLAFGAAGLHYLLSNDFSRWLLRNRRYLGLAFASIFTVHFIGILCRMFFYPEQFAPEMVRQFVGGSAWAFALLMALTSSNAAVAAMGPRAWKLLHSVGGYYIWLLFLAAYAGNVQAKPLLGAYLAFVLLVVFLRWNKRFKGLRFNRRL